MRGNENPHPETFETHPQSAGFFLFSFFFFLVGMGCVEFVFIVLGGKLG